MLITGVNHGMFVRLSSRSFEHCQGHWDKSYIQLKYMLLEQKNLIKKLIFYSGYALIISQGHIANIKVAWREKIYKSCQCHIFTLDKAKMIILDSLLMKICLHPDSRLFERSQGH